MIERAFVETQPHEGNEHAIRQFAITQAGQLLEAAGVRDHAIKDQALASKPQKAVEQSFYTISEGLGIISTSNIGGKPKEQLEAMAKSVRTVSGYAQDMIHNPKFTTLEKNTPQELVKLPVSALGLPGTPTTRQIIERATHSRIGNKALELCRAEVGPHLAISDTEQPLNDWYYIMHEPLTDRRGVPRVVGLGRYADGLWLNGAWARPENRWNPEYQVVFALRDIDSVKA